MEEDLVQLNVRVPRLIREKLNDGKDSPTVIVNRLLEEYFSEDTKEDDNLTSFLKSQLEVKDAQISELHREISKLNDSQQMYIKQVQTAINPLVVKELAEHVQDKRTLGEKFKALLGR